MTSTAASPDVQGLLAPRSSISMLRCQIGMGQYLIPLTRVVEIIRYVRPTPVPQTPPWVSGVMNLRGRVIPVIDLAVKFAEAACAPDEWTRIVLVEADLEGEATTLGLVTMRAGEIHDLQPSDLEPPPSEGPIRVEFLQGLLKLEQGRALALDLDKVLSSNEQVSVTG